MSVTVHMKNLQVLVTEMLKVQSNFSPEKMKNVLPITETNHNYNFRNISNFASCRTNTVRYLSEFLSYLGTRLWEFLPDEYRYNLLNNSKLRSEHVAWKLPSAVERNIYSMGGLN